MSRKTYEHSAYWYAYHYGWTYSEAKTHTGKYLDMHTVRPRMREVAEGESYGDAWFERRNASTYFDSTFNPLILGVCIAMDIGILMRGRNVCMSRYFPVCVFASLYVQP